MVHFKRTPVTFVPDPPIRDDNTQVWIMPMTGEVFTDYDRYTARLDFYRKKQFTNPITGQSNLNFFDAREAEDEDAQEIKSIFPVPLRYPVCRRVHHSTIGRLEDLVTRVHMELKDDYYPGEHVIAQVDEARDMRQPGIIRDKITFPPSAIPTLHQQPAVSTYFVTIPSGDGGTRDILLDTKKLSRDRRIYTRNILRSFIRNITTRQDYRGAPWEVKPELVAEFKLPKEIPRQFTQEALLKARRDQAAPKPPGETTFFHFLKPTQGLQKGQHYTINFPQAVAPSPGMPGQTGVFRAAPGIPQLPYPPPHNGFPPPPQPYHTTIPTRPLPPPPPPQIKYPIEDLDIVPLRKGLKRPTPKFICDDVPKGGEPPKESLGIKMEFMSDLVMVWQTLNVHAEVFLLDSFTLDDFIEALTCPVDVANCELLVEIHCAILKLLVDEKGTIEVLSEIAPEFSDEVDDAEDKKRVMGIKSTPERSKTPPARRTRSSLNKKEAEEHAAAPIEPKLGNRAYDLLLRFDWEENFATRNFSNGGWQALVVHCLRQAANKKKNKEICDKILAHLVPPDSEPTPQTVAEQFNTLDVNLRIATLSILCGFAVATNAIRDYMQKCSLTMTKIRNDKISSQREKKDLVKQLSDLDQQRKIEYPANMSASPQPDANGDVSMSLTEELQDPEGSDNTEDEPPVNGRVLRKASSRKRKREDEVSRKEKEKKNKAEAAKFKQTNEFTKLLQKIETVRERITECEAKIAEFDDELRENYCQLLKPLGRDRFCNSYWWLERWGMPFAGLPDASTAEYGYASGRLFIQGPDLLHQGLLELTPEENEKYKSQVGMTMPQRRELEEGPVNLTSSLQWGYYDDPEDVQKLIEWLDSRGAREVRLRKELVTWQDKIGEYMTAWKDHLAKREAEKMEEEEPTGVKTRHKTYSDNEMAKYWCLRWHNSYAEHELNHIHSEHPRPKPPKGGQKGKKSKR
ncbi:hypothetical protein K490DRAFT_57804 [Saccharata proteae CBS 121410]|uniref:WAC domain-containing protein n=1 Tax=Saccharata proteae CBS 121410 TaxID=1314787 RepID=A0A9P4HVQ1_9PEZI|nr:hypothetical protein K490DRAFT_57804 [Saccharata proteae CBS 121410]